MPPPLLIFVHGLGGEAVKTWGNFPELIKSDSNLSKFDIDFFSYPTSLFRFPFSKKYPKIQTLAKALKTQIDSKHTEYSDIVLVCHSLGGLIARKYLVDEVMSKIPLRIRKLVLYAVPNNGSGLASVAKQISWRHNQLSQLCKDSDLIEDLNEVWFKLKIESMLQINYIMAALDDVIDQASAQAYWGNPQLDTIVDRGHKDVVKPLSNQDTSFLVLRKALLNIPKPLSIDLNQFITPVCLEPPNKVRRNFKYQVIAFDLDGTLLRGFEFSWTQIWKYLNFPEIVYKEGMARYLRGEVTYQEWCDWAVQQFRSKSLNREQFSEITKGLTVTNGLEDVLSILRKDGFITAIISGGVNIFLEEMIPNAEELFDYICINQLQFDDQGIINGVNATPYDFEGKATALEQICKRHGLKTEGAVFVGEGFNDVEAAKIAGLSIAYPPHSQTFQLAAHEAVKEDNLNDILRYVL